MYAPKHMRNAWEGELGFLLWAVGVYGTDQLSKALVIDTIRYLDSVPVIPDFFHLTHILNRGASFGLLQDQVSLFVWITGFVLLFNCWVVFFWQGANRPMRIILGLITGGALGNLTDRLRYGAVVDFIDFRGIWQYIFNIADVGVVCGGFLLVVLLILEEKRHGAKTPKH